MEKEKDRLSDPVRCLSGVGPKIEVRLEEKGIKTVEDLLWFLPFKYLDRSAVKPIEALTEGERASVVGRVTASRSLFFRHSRKKAYEAVVDDGTGTISIKWFQWIRDYLKKVCKEGNLLMLSGTVGRFGDKIQMVHPEIFILESEDQAEDCKGTTPVYSEIDGVKQGTIRALVRTAFDDYAAHIESVLPEEVEKRHGLIPLRRAFSMAHFPEETCASDLTESTFYKRLVFEEYFLFQAALLMKKSEAKRNKGISLSNRGKYYKLFASQLPFELTVAQEKVRKEIERDMGLGVPMNRLLQGDVGSGKTICAVMASYMAIDNGYQAAFMAPTEILAEQHYHTIHRTFEDMGVTVAFLRGGMGKERAGILKDVKNGKTKVVVGTHALIQESVHFKNLGLVVIDEQHRFGVMQRKLLKEKGPDSTPADDGQRTTDADALKLNTPVPTKEGQHSTLKTAVTPHTLVMTATPIPRTLSMVVYGDLDVSVIDEMPKGRQKVLTKVLLDKDRPRAYKLIGDELKVGRQAFIVYPLVEESEKMELLNAKEMAVHLQESVFSFYRVGLLHGRMRPDEKEEMMLRFKSGEVDILVCTTVVEVGIDIPNATIIVIEHAERFGLSQLHQLRGRVGRSVHPSKCILITSEKRTALATKRLKVMEETADGFKVAEEDMKLRGPGDILGVRQAGLPDFRIGDIVRDVSIMVKAREMAGPAIAGMTADELRRVRRIALERWKGNIHLNDVA
jgi:ATP-dependent DNA helicase RecG